MEPEVGRLVLLEEGRGGQQRLDVSRAVNEQAQPGVLSLQVVDIVQCHLLVGRRLCFLGAARVVDEPEVVVGGGTQLLCILGVGRSQFLRLLVTRNNINKVSPSYEGSRESQDFRLGVRRTGVRGPQVRMTTT